jgi:hypothetical protein
MGIDGTAVAIRTLVSGIAGNALSLEHGPQYLGQPRLLCFCGQVISHVGAKLGLAAVSPVDGIIK